MSRIAEAFFVEKLARSTSMGGARTVGEVVKLGAKCGITRSRAERVAMEAGWPSVDALHRSVADNLAALDGGARTVEVEVPVEVATRYLDHPSPLVQACARLIADDYRRLERHVALYEAHTNGVTE